MNKFWVVVAAILVSGSAYAGNSCGVKDGYYAGDENFRLVAAMVKDCEVEKIRNGQWLSFGSSASWNGMIIEAEVNEAEVNDENSSVDLHVGDLLVATTYKQGEFLSGRRWQYYPLRDGEYSSTKYPVRFVVENGSVAEVSFNGQECEEVTGRVFGCASVGSVSTTHLFNGTFYVDFDLSDSDVAVRKSAVLAEEWSPGEPLWVTMWPLELTPPQKNDSE